MVVRLLAICLLLFSLALSFVPVCTAATPGATHPVTMTDLYLGAVEEPVGNLGPRLPMITEPGTTAGQLLILAPGVNAAGIIDQPDGEIWYRPQAFTRDTEFIGSADLALYFAIQAEATGFMHFEMISSGPNGAETVLYEETVQFAYVLPGEAFNTRVALDGLVVPRGHFLAFRLVAETGSGLVTLAYGDDASPSGFTGVKFRALDSDGDGIADSDEVDMGKNPLNPNDADPTGDDDGDGVNNYYESYYNYNVTNADSNGDGTSDCDDDADGDGQSLCVEIACGTDPYLVDTDGNGIPDGEDVCPGNRPVPGTTSTGGSSGGLLDDVKEPVAAVTAFAIGTTLILVGLLGRL